MVNRISRQYHYAECATVTVVTVLACAKISREKELSRLYCTGSPSSRSYRDMRNDRPVVVPRVQSDLSSHGVHGGQEWQLLPNFVEDLSVTTNGLGPPEAALAAAREAVGTAQHYPPMSFEPQRSELARFLWGASAEHATDRLLLGNGASELIDLLTRDAASASDGAQRWWWCDRRPRPPLALSPPRPLAAYYLLLL